MVETVVDLQGQIRELQAFSEVLLARMAEMDEKLISLSSKEVTRALQATSQLSPGDTAWMLTATALVLFMTIPGLMLYYSGMVRSKNVLATVMQIFSITCLITFLWLCFGYSLAFGPANSGEGGLVYGNASRFWLRGMQLESFHQMAPSIPESVFCAYELVFAIITPSLICGAFADRMKYVPMLLFIGLWHLLVYCPTAHSVWHPSGFLYQEGVLDYAGGCAVHIASGMSGLVASIMLGQRKGFGTEDFEPHSILLTAVGSSMLWVGWFGFNAGSGFSASYHAGYALLMTQISTATAAITWMMTEWYVRGQPSVLGMVSGAVCGLVAVTPAAGYIDQTGSFFIGFLAGPACYFAIRSKHYFGYDDPLDAFGVHAIAGTLGMLLTGFFATDEITGDVNGVFYSGVHEGGTQLGRQIYAIVVTAGWATFMTFIILFFIEGTMGLRVSEEEEETGLDRALYKESMFSKEYMLQRDSAPKFDEPVQIRFGSSHSRNVVQEIGSQHGFPLANMDGTPKLVSNLSAHNRHSPHRGIQHHFRIEEGSIGDESDNSTMM